MGRVSPMLWCNCWRRAIPGWRRSGVSGIPSSGFTVDHLSIRLTAVPSPFYHPLTTRHVRYKATLRRLARPARPTHHHPPSSLWGDAVHRRSIPENRHTSINGRPSTHHPSSRNTPYIPLHTTQAKSIPLREPPDRLPRSSRRSSLAIISSGDM